MTEQQLLELGGESGWRAWSQVEKAHLLQRVQAEIVRRKAAAWQPYPWQVAPRELGPHEMWLLMGGRGIGKTDGGSHYVLDHIAGPPCDRRVRGGHRVAIVAPTLGDAAESCVKGPSGLQAYDARVQLRSSVGGAYVRFPGGAEGKLFGAHSPADVERLRAGGNRCLVWLEEAAAMRYLGGVLEHTRLGLRIGPRPHFVATTTPRPRPELVELVKSARTVITRGKTREATHLDELVREALEELYAGTRLGRQELDGELLEDVEGALWTQLLIDQERIRSTEIPELSRVVVAVDPNAGGDAECGIVVVGLGRELLPDLRGRLVPHGYVLEDCSDHFAHPGAWAEAAVSAYERWEADAVVAEVNNGGDMVGHTIHTVDRSVRYRSVTASRGKAVRAEPVQGLYEQRRIHHVGRSLARLEDQMTTWTDSPGEPSPDRMDALVWGCWDLLLRRRSGSATVA